ncbi:NAD(+)/NADH kinase [Zoogloea sp.]|uniref:NAD(+)/NADH kinase n=1 Tax=Zoogloea sp. TaxID=49181 RepID=UPI001B5091B7|nr:NAD(+)/NADH kinase [Zoogloea sp.]MBP8133098.1 NAD(+)/NADH kinase [Zoogloea sp.]HPI61303.1 NAD(+)/NADH kinase [Zoogloea sp.]
MKQCSSSSIVGIVANPASGRDIRRLTSKALVFPTVEKVNMIERLLGALGATGVGRVLMMPDLVGISAGLTRAIDGHRADRDQPWPAVEFLSMRLSQGAADTVEAVRRMREAGVAVIVVLGGDGTHRIVAGECADTPLATLSSGTNNAFPDLREATLTGLAAGLVASGAVAVDAAARRNKRLRVRCAGQEELALVDVCVTRLEHVGARAVWDPASIAELYVTFAEPGVIGLSSIAAMHTPVGRDEPRGGWVHCAPAGPAVLAPIAPGLVRPIGIAAAGVLLPGQPMAIGALRGSIALDGEREIELDGRQAASVTLELDGPLTLDVPATLAAGVVAGALQRVLITGP